MFYRRTTPRFLPFPGLLFSPVLHCFVIQKPRSLCPARKNPPFLKAWGSQMFYRSDSCRGKGLRPATGQTHRYGRGKHTKQTSARVRVLATGLNQVPTIKCECRFPAHLPPPKAKESMSPLMKNILSPVHLYTC